MWHQLRFRVSSQLGRALVLLLVTLAIPTAAAFARSHMDAPKFVSVPIYYLTDRNLQGTGFGNRRRYESNCLHRMYYGTAWVTVENHNHDNDDSVFRALGWKHTDTRAASSAPKDEIDPARPVVAKRQFFGRLQSALEQAGTDHLCVYVHGAEEGFEDALLDAAELSYALRRPLVLYSWPSTPKLLDYAEDNGNAEWSQGHFVLFCRDLIAFKELHPLHLTLLAHSMGNRFIFRSIHALYGHQLISDCELISPDMDIDTCRHYLMGFRRIDNNTTIRLYVSNKDKMLRLSQKLFGGYARLGEDVDSKLVPSRSMEQVTVRKNADERHGQGGVTLSDAPEEAHDIDAADPAEATAAADAVLQRIDFTAIDKGLTGHSIPFQLIGNLVNGREPGDGLALVEDRSEQNKRSLQVIPSTPKRGTNSQP